MIRKKIKCSVDGCEAMATHKGMCVKHYARVNRTGDPHKARQYGGSRIMTTGGYVIIKKNGIKQYEHIILAEKALGRKLPKGAQVHHMNETPWDNFTSFNLVICPSQSYHRLLHERMKQYAARHR